MLKHVHHTQQCKVSIEQLAQKNVNHQSFEG